MKNEKEKRKKKKEKKKKEKKKTKRKKKRQKKKKRKASVPKPVAPATGYQAPAPACIDGWWWMVDGGGWTGTESRKKSCISKISPILLNIFFWLFRVPLEEVKRHFL